MPNPVASAYRFDPARHRPELEELLGALREAESLDKRAYDRVVRSHPRSDGGFFSKSQVVRGERYLARSDGREPDRELLARIRMKPVRTLSGVAPVTVLTKPWPCPGRCVFCPNDVRMPKSYLSREPGAQRAAHQRFDPYAQTAARLWALHQNGHPLDKVELIVLGGTWSFYPEAYQVWFVKRCFDALNDFESLSGSREFAVRARGVAMDDVPGALDGRRIDDRTYNRTIAEFWRDRDAGEGTAGWAALEEAHRRNETARARCVGLVLETRPDRIDEEEVRRLRRLGATRAQIGVQSLSDEILEVNKRGHDVAATRRAFRLLRNGGFKIHAHWMPNLLGSDPSKDREDYRRLFDDPELRPDELKIYPCSLIESAELMAYHERGEWKPYSRDELVELLVDCVAATPEYCRLTRIVRDIPGDDIVVGNRTTNLRQVVDRVMEERGISSRDVRARELRRRALDPGDLVLAPREYATGTTREHFLELSTPGDRLAGFLRLSLPSEGESRPEELAGRAMIREIHVYGQMAEIGAGGANAQHQGLGRRLVERAKSVARESGYPGLAVISSVGTREYYRGLGFRDGELYQLLELACGEPAGQPRPE